MGPRTSRSSAPAKVTKLASSHCPPACGTNCSVTGGSIGRGAVAGCARSAGSAALHPFLLALFGITKVEIEVRIHYREAALFVVPVQRRSRILENTGILLECASNIRLPAVSDE